MDPALYPAMAQVEDTHWWFVARRFILRSFLRRLGLPKDAAILEAGCGTGGNFALLSAFGRLEAMEMDAGARELANRRGAIQAQAGSLPDAIPFAQSFDLIALLDVLEHLREDEASLKALHARLKAGGRLLVTVPAFSFLSGPHDVLHHHFRRYTLPQLADLLRRTGFRVRFASYFNFWLFPLIASARLAMRRFDIHPRQPGILILPPAPLNRLLTWIFGSEAFLLRWLRLPFGVSIIIVAQRQETP